MDRSTQPRRAALARWSKSDPVAGTARARAKFLDRFLDQVDPERELEPDERERRARRARQVYFSKMAQARHRAEKKQNGAGP
jgi:hypothetical protein